MPSYSQIGKPPPRPTKREGTFTAPTSSGNDRDDYVMQHRTYWGNAFDSYLASLGLTADDLTTLGQVDPQQQQPPATELSLDEIMAGFDPFQWGFTFDVDTLTYEEVLQDGQLAAGFGGASILYLVWGPENMNSLDFLDELDAWLSSDLGDQIVVAFNPEWAATQALVQQGGFATVILAGHGSQGNAFMVDEQGEAMSVPVNQLAELFEGTEVENVFLNICEGMAGVDGIASKLQAAGINVIGWARRVSDDDARAAVEMLVEILDEMNADSLDIAHLNELARRFDGEGGNLVIRVAEWAEAGGSPEELYGIFADNGNPGVDLYTFLDEGYGPSGSSYSSGGGGGGAGGPGGGVTYLV